MKFALSSLLYYDLSTIKHGEIRKAFGEYQLLLTALIEAVNAFESEDLKKFDALVGENACQIRALRMALIHSNDLFSIDLKKTAIQIGDEISKLFNKKIKSLVYEDISFAEVLKQYELDVFLTGDELFALKSFILSEAKDTDSVDLSSRLLTGKQRCMPDKIRKFGPDVTTRFLKKLAGHLRLQLSQSSVQFVQKAAAHLQDKDLMQMLSDDFLYRHNDLACLPAFWTYKALLGFAKRNEIPLIVRVSLLKEVEGTRVVLDEKTYFFKAEENALGQWYYHLTEPTKEDSTKAAWVIEGVADCSASACWNEKVLTDCVISAILAGAADHRQYPNSSQNIQVRNLEYFYFKSMARNKGFSLENPSSFFIQHVYTSKVGRMLGGPCSVELFSSKGDTLCINAVSSP